MLACLVSPEYPEMGACLVDVGWSVWLFVCLDQDFLYVRICMNEERRLIVFLLIQKVL